MRFEWDAAKDKANRAKHGLVFDAALDFEWHDAVLFGRTRAPDGSNAMRRSGIYTASYIP